MRVAYRVPVSRASRAGRSSTGWRTAVFTSPEAIPKRPGATPPSAARRSSRVKPVRRQGWRRRGREGEPRDQTPTGSLLAADQLPTCGPHNAQLSGNLARARGSILSPLVSAGAQVDLARRPCQTGPRDGPCPPQGAAALLPTASPAGGQSQWRRLVGSSPRCSCSRESSACTSCPTVCCLPRGYLVGLTRITP